MQVAAGTLDAEADEVELHVRRSQFRARARKHAHMPRADRQRPVAMQQPAPQRGQPARGAAHLVVERERTRALVHAAALVVILEILADTRAFAKHLDAVLTQQRAGADTRELQQLRRVDRATTEDHLARRARLEHTTVASIGDTHRAAALEQHAHDVCPAHHPQVGARPRRFQVGARGAAAPALPGGELVVADTLLGGTVEVLVAGQAGLLGGGDVGLAQLVAMTVGNAERAVRAVPLVGAALLTLGTPEVRQDVVVAPALVAELSPMVEILALAADVDQAVDRAASAEHLAAWPADAARVAAGHRLALVAPADARIEDAAVVAGRHMQPRAAVGRPGLEQQHPVGGVG